MSSIVVVGIGAMGGGIARALLESASVSSVSGFDKNWVAVEAFHKEAAQGNKNGTEDAPTSLKQCVHSGVNFIILSLVNESQCEIVCFEEDECLFNLLDEGSCVILTSTVTGT
jgi:3-hydroxyisobutyrate dehydrogenase-like beta-hydroxyacid dehydrogenase